MIHPEALHELARSVQADIERDAHEARRASELRKARAGTTAARERTSLRHAIVVAAGGLLVLIAGLV
jgi:hypothetical protein